MVFLADIDGTWNVIASGTGLSCSDWDLSADLVELCTALGLR